MSLGILRSDGCHEVAHLGLMAVFQPVPTKEATVQREGEGS